jgi:hypothetical protein
MSKSTYVCQRCGCAVYTWREPGKWKHAAGPHKLSCGEPPIVMERTEYGKWMAAEAAGARAALRRFLGR